MPWFAVHHKKIKTIHYYESKKQAYLEQLPTKDWSCKITPIVVKKLSVNELSLFLLELLKGLEAGLKLHQIFNYIKHNSHSKKVALVCCALETELLKGKDFNVSLKLVVDSALHGYCDLFVHNSTPEQLQTNLTLMHEQITQLKEWTTRFYRALIYPFFVIQMALIIWLVNSVIQQNTVDLPVLEMSYYTSITLLQVGVLLLLKSGLAIKLIENCSISFRLSKTFSLLTASVSVGNSLQKTLTTLPSHFSHTSTQQELLMVYYKLRLGRDYSKSFPATWFPKESLLALKASCHSGDINRALVTASKLHNTNWQKQLSIIEKVCPIVALLIAAIFVSRTLVALYNPLLDLS